MLNVNVNPNRTSSSIKSNLIKHSNQKVAIEAMKKKPQ